MRAKRSEPTVTVSFRVTQLQRDRLSLLTSFLGTTSSQLFGDHINGQWDNALKNGRMQEWLNILAGAPQMEEQTTAKMKAVNM